MGRHTTANYSCAHWVSQVGHDHFRLSWTVDFYYPDSRLRHPRCFRRDTDEAGARRFCAKWKLQMPNAAPKE